MSRTLTAPVVLLALALSACGTSEPVEERTTQIEEADAGGEETAAEEAGGDVEAEIGSTHEFSDGLTVELSGIERAVSGEWAYPENTPYVRFTVQVQNGTGQAVDLSLMHVECQVGEDGRVGEFIADTEQGIGDGFTSTVMDGRNATADYGCAMPEEESYVQIEVSVGDDWMERPTIFFTGEV